MIQKDFWRNARIGVIGGGSWGTILAQMAAHNCREVRVWLRDEERVRSINATRMNERYFPGLRLHEKVYVYNTLERVIDTGLNALIWALPSDACREQARKIAPLLTGEEIVLHATKGIESGTLKRVSEILAE